MNYRKSSLRSCRSLIALVAFAAMAGSSLFIGTSVSAAKNKVTTPTISCVEGGSTQASIYLNVCAPAGGTGLPAGFSIQWMTCAEYASHTEAGPDGILGNDDDITVANTWYASDDSRLCKASFSGNANLSRYNLSAGQCVTINIGELLFDEGASTTCPDALSCGTCYVFRAFGHATNALNRSDFTGNTQCSTLECDHDEDGCTLTQGYWKTHGPGVCVSGNNSNEWPVTSLTLGSVSYTDIELCSILNTPAAGNGLIALAHQLIAAKLNVAKGADDTDVAAAIAAADALIGGLVVPPVGSGSLPSSATSSLTGTLTSYNEGAIGPGHCQ